jgi:hypothetical protein
MLHHLRKAFAGLTEKEMMLVNGIILEESPADSE